MGCGPGRQGGGGRAGGGAWLRQRLRNFILLVNGIQCFKFVIIRAKFLPFALIGAARVFLRSPILIGVRPDLNVDLDLVAKHVRPSNGPRNRRPAHHQPMPGA